MSLLGHPKKERGQLASKTAHKRIKAEYHALDFVQAPFRFVFWLIEQRKSRLQDRLANEGNAE
jgi:hypothetical protein